MEKEKNEIIKYMKRQVFFIYLIIEWLFYFAFEKTSYALPKWHVTITLFVPVGKSSNSRSKMFYKIDALKNLAIFTGKHLFCSFVLINFIK